MISNLFCTMFISLTPNGMWINFMLYWLLTLSFWHFKIFYLTVSSISTVKKLFYLVYYAQKEQSWKLCIHDGDWHETFNLLHESGCKMLHLVMSCMSQTKNLNKPSRMRSTDRETFLRAHERNVLFYYNLELIFMRWTCFCRVTH